MALLFNLAFTFELLHLSLGLYYEKIDINTSYYLGSTINNIKYIRDQLSCRK